MTAELVCTARHPYDAVYRLTEKLRCPWCDDPPKRSCNRCRKPTYSGGICQRKGCDPPGGGK